jgi:hypothetical protein
MTFDEMLASLTPFQRQYVAAALETEEASLVASKPAHLVDPGWHDGYCVEDLADETLAQMIADCVAFRAAHAADLDGLDEREAGADFAVSRSGADAGFCDRGLGERGERLHVAAKACGELSLYHGADNLVHTGGQ